MRFVPPAPSAAQQPRSALFAAGNGSRRPRLHRETWSPSSWLWNWSRWSRTEQLSMSTPRLKRTAPEPAKPRTRPPPRTLPALVAARAPAPPAALLFRQARAVAPVREAPASLPALQAGLASRTPRAFVTVPPAAGGEGQSNADRDTAAVPGRIANCVRRTEEHWRARQGQTRPASPRRSGAIWNAKEPPVSFRRFPADSVCPRGNRTSTAWHTRYR